MLLTKQDTEDMTETRGNFENNDRYVQGKRVGSVRGGQFVGDETD